MNTSGIPASLTSKSALAFRSLLDVVTAAAVDRVIFRIQRLHTTFDVLKIPIMVNNMHFFNI